jgi:hypothetical protein
LLAVVGGQEQPPQSQGGPDPATLGRCGPDNRWRWLGDVYTPECKAHDQAVRDGLAGGSSRIGAHWNALPLLPQAVGSYFRERFRSR